MADRLSQLSSPGLAGSLAPRILLLAVFVLLIALVIFNLKNVFFVWHLRLANALRYVLRSQRTEIGESPSHIFHPVITQSHSPLTEIDLNLHKSNSTYFTDLDIARTHLISALFSKGIEKARFAESEDLIGGGNAQLFVMLGSVFCSFKKEIRPYEKYEMWSRMLSWDKKWFYVVTHFVSKEPGTATRATGVKEKGDRVIFATAVSKCVFKKGRLSVDPSTMLRLSGHLSESPLQQLQHSESGDAVVQFEEVSETQAMNDHKNGQVLAEMLDGLEKAHGELEVDVPALARRKDECFAEMAWEVVRGTFDYYMERCKGVGGQ